MSTCEATCVNRSLLDVRPYADGSFYSGTCPYRLPTETSDTRESYSHSIGFQTICASARKENAVKRARLTGGAERANPGGSSLPGILRPNLERRRSSSKERGPGFESRLFTPFSQRVPLTSGAPAVASCRFIHQSLAVPLSNLWHTTRLISWALLAIAAARLTPHQP